VALLDRAIVRLLPAVPRPVVRRISERYIAGTELADACRVVKELNDAGKMATIDVLGEEITRREEALEIAREYGHVFETIEREGLDSNVSVKLTGLGLKLGYEFCRENLATLVRGAAERSNFVRIDMEDSSCTDDTLRVYRDLRQDGLDNVGIVLQAALRRTVDDVHELADLGLNVRLCKGIYIEPPEIAYQEFEEVRESFVRSLEARALRAPAGGIRVPDAPRRSAGAGRRARPRWAPAEDLRTVRSALVLVLPAAAAGEPEDRRLHRGRHAPAARPQARRHALISTGEVARPEMRE
jgi:proline dehydrogenase